MWTHGQRACLPLDTFWTGACMELPQWEDEGNGGLGMCLALEEGSGLGQGWRASEGEVGTLRLAGEGSCTPGS